MSHLKKFSDKLRTNFQASILPIIVHGEDDDLKLLFDTYRPTSISRVIREHNIKSLIKTAAYNGLASLSANQIGLNISAFVINKKLENNKWFGYTASEDDYSVYLNPTLRILDPDFTTEDEECPSLPNILAEIERYKKIDVDYMNGEGEYVHEEIDDFKARVFMHENDHLNGDLMTTFSICFGRLKFKDPKKNPFLIKALNENKEQINQEVEFYIKHLDSSKNEFIPTKDEKSYYVRQIFNKTMEEDFTELISECLQKDFDLVASRNKKKNNPK